MAIQIETRRPRSKVAQSLINLDTSTTIDEIVKKALLQIVEDIHPGCTIDLKAVCKHTKAREGEISLILKYSEPVVPIRPTVVEEKKDSK